MDEDNVSLDLSISRKEPSNSIEEPLPDALPNQEDDEKIESVDHANLDISQFLHCEIITEEKQINPEVEAGQGKKRFACPKCQQSFGQKSSLNRHLMIHTGEKPYKCEFCGKTFRQRPTLNNHLKIHSDEKPYKCEFCDKTFRKRATLIDHLQIHTGKWRYTCQICGSGFNHPSHLKTHSKTHTDLESNSTLTNNSGNESPKAGPSGCSSK